MAYSVLGGWLKCKPMAGPEVEKRTREFKRREWRRVVRDTCEGEAKERKFSNSIGIPPPCQRRKAIEWREEGDSRVKTGA